MNWFVRTMNRGINIRRACFDPALNIGAGHVMSMASVAKLPSQKDKFVYLCPVQLVLEQADRLWDEGRQPGTEAETWS
jgi:hypothetical protein